MVDREIENKLLMCIKYTINMVSFFSPEKQEIM